jgi:hypothetical protein
MIPSPDSDWSQFGHFALSFNGYEYWGGFGPCGQIANRAQEAYTQSQKMPSSLTELRTCLFFEQRRWRHYGYSPDDQAMRYIRALVREIRTRVETQKTD